MLLNRVFYWTGGHPYLAQTLCEAVATCTIDVPATISRRRDTLKRVVDNEVKHRFFVSESAREERNLKFVQSRLTQGNPEDLPSVLLTYQRVLNGMIVEDKPASPIHASLKLAGVVRVDANGRLRTRNRIYERVFGLGWVQRTLPRDSASLSEFESISENMYGILSYEASSGQPVQDARTALLEVFKDRRTANVLSNTFICAIT